MNSRKKILMTYEGEPLRADKALPLLIPDLTRSAAAALMDEGGVTIGETPVSKSRILKSGDRLTILLPQQEDDIPAPQDIPLEIVYEDDMLLVVNKPAGMVVHPAPGNREGTLCNALLAHCGGKLSEAGGRDRPGIVHRLDKDTSGLLIAAKTDEAHRHLAAQIKAHSFLREYEAVVYGRLKEDTGTVSAPVGRHPKKRRQMAVVPGGREAVTHFTVLARNDKYTRLQLRLQTGRTHQIRVHMAHLGHPVAGDPLYAGRRTAPGLSFQCLHAKRIGFVHPGTGQWLDFSAPLPDWFTAFLNRVGLAEPDSLLPTERMF